MSFLEDLGLQEEMGDSRVFWLPLWSPTFDCQGPIAIKGLSLLKPQLPYL